MTANPESDAPVGSTAVVGDEAPAQAERSAWTSERWAVVVFGAYVFLSFWLLLLKFGAKRWFYGDDWLLLLNRMDPSVDTLLTPQHGHNSAVPILIFETLYRVFGIRTYVPYLVAIISLHLIMAVLLRVIMRRAGVGPWLATLVAGMIVLFGPGQVSILYAIQITQVGTIVLGLGQMLLADHDGRLDRRDWIGLGLGFVSLFCSALAPAMIVAVGAAVLIRRGWRPALFHTVPLGAVFVAWYLKYSANVPSETAGFDHSYPLTDYAGAILGGRVRFVQRARLLRHLGRRPRDPARRGPGHRLDTARREISGSGPSPCRSPSSSVRSPTSSSLALLTSRPRACSDSRSTTTSTRVATSTCSWP